MFCDTDTCPGFTIDGFRASARAALRLLASGAGAICSLCGNPFNPMYVGADDKIYSVHKVYQWQTHGATSKDGGSTIQTGNGHWRQIGSVGTLAVGIFYSGMNGALQATKAAAQDFMQQAPKASQLVRGVKDWASNAPLDWERDFMSEETKQYKELLDSAAEGLIEAGDFIESNAPELERDITLIIP